jgi:hypothetical protein
VAFFAPDPDLRWDNRRSRRGTDLPRRAVDIRYIQQTIVHEGVKTKQIYAQFVILALPGTEIVPEVAVTINGARLKWSANNKRRSLPRARLFSRVWEIFLDTVKIYALRSIPVPA